MHYGKRCLGGKKTHERTSTVKQSKMQILTSRFKSLRMQESEKIGELYAKLSDLSNQAFADQVKSIRMPRL